MKTLDAFKKHFETDLKDTLDKVEKARVLALWLSIVRIILAAGVIGLAYVYRENQDYLIGLGIFLLTELIFLSIFIYIKKRFVKRQYKEQVIGSMIKHIDERLEYRPKQKITRMLFEKSQLFGLKPDKFDGDDLVEGTFGKIKLKFCELHAQTKISDDKGKTKYKTLFKGIFLTADFNKPLSGQTFLVPSTPGGILKNLGRLMEKAQVFPELVKLGEPSFEKHFNIHGTDHTRARDILSRNLIDRLIELKQYSEQIHLSLIDENVYIAIEVRRNLFEPPFWTSVKKFKRVERYFKYLELAIDIIEDLDNNKALWTTHSMI